jgi:hypothetical protein
VNRDNRLGKRTQECRIVDVTRDMQRSWLALTRHVPDIAQHADNPFRDMWQLQPTYGAARFFEVGVQGIE